MPLIDGKYDYFAFISYKEEDAKWARWLQRKLENYKFTSDLRKNNPDLPERITPIYEYKSEAGGGRLKEVLWNGLASSKYLIVICSPRATKSKWINDGIQHFVDSKQEENIIPFIIEGNPKANNPDDECFPQALLDLKDDRELRGININEMGRDAAAVKVISRMLNLKFDTLWHRHEREEKKRRWKWIGSAILLALMSVGIVTYIAQKNVELDKVNNRLEQANTNLQQANKVISEERDRANLERRNAEKANESLTIANDSIREQEIIIKKTIVELENSNNQLKKERDNVLKSNWKIMEKQARAVAGKAESILENGDACTATLLALDILPNNLQKIDKPYTPDAESILRRASLSKNAVLKGHSSVVNSVSFSPDNHKLVSSGWDRSTFLWDTNTGSGIKLNGINGTYASGESCFSPNGKQILTCGFDVKVFDTQSLLCLKILDVNHESIKSACFSPDGNRILVSTYDKIFVFDSNTYHLIKTLNYPSDKLKMESFSPDGNMLCCFAEYGDDKEACIINIETGEKLLSIPQEDVSAMVFSPDGRYVATASFWGGGTKLWDSQSGELIRIIHEGNDTDVVFSPNGQFIASASRNGSVSVFNMITRETKQFVGHTQTVNSLSFSTDGKLLASASWDNTARIWDLYGYEPLSSNITPSYDQKIFSSPDGEKYAKVNWGEPVKIISHDTNSLLYQLPEDTWQVHTLDFSPDGKTFATASQDNTVRIWDASNGNELNQFDHGTIVYCAVFSPDGKHIASGTGSAHDRKIRLWNVQSGKTDNVINLPDCDINSLAYSADGKYLACLLYNGNVHGAFPSTLRVYETSEWYRVIDYDIPAIIHNNSNVIYDSSFFIVTTDEHQYKYFFPSLQELIDNAQQRFKNRLLTPKERKDYYLD